MDWVSIYMSTYNGQCTGHTLHSNVVASSCSNNFGWSKALPPKVGVMSWNTYWDILHKLFIVLLQCCQIQITRCKALLAIE